MRGWTWGWIDRSGAFAVAPGWVAAGPFVDGLARAVPLGNLRTVIVNRLGREVVAGTFDVVGEFRGGLAAVNVGGAGGAGGAWGFVDRNGVIVIPLRFTDVGPFCEGVAPALTREGWGYVDPTAELVIRAQFEQATSFSGGLAAVAVDKRWGYIDRSGRFVIPPVFDVARPFSEGVGRVQRRGEQALIDRDGQVISAWFDRCSPMIDGAAVCATRDGERRVDVRGQAFGALWDEIRGGSEGVWAVRRGGLWWLVDGDDVDRGGGAWEGVELPTDGLASVRGPDGWGVVDVRSGVSLVPPRSGATATLGEGRAAKRDGERWVIVNRMGRAVSGTAWIALGRFREGAIAARDAQGWTLADRDGQALFAARFDLLEGLSSGLAAARPLRGAPVLFGPVVGVRTVPRLAVQHPTLARGGALRLCVRFAAPLTGSAMIAAHQRFEAWKDALPGAPFAEDPWVVATELRVAMADRPDSGVLISGLVEVLVADALGVVEVIVSGAGEWSPGAWDGPVWPVCFEPAAIDPGASTRGRDSDDDELNRSFQDNWRRVFSVDPPPTRFVVFDGAPRRWAWRVFRDDLRQTLSGGAWRLRTTELLEVAAACALRNDLDHGIGLVSDGEDIVVGLTEGRGR